MSIPFDVTFHPAWWHENAGICFYEDFFSDPLYRMDADVRMRKTLYDHFGDAGLGEKNPTVRPIIGSDLIASGYLHAGILGCEIRYSEKNPPEVICRNLTDLEAISLEIPDIEQNTLWNSMQSQICMLESRFGYVLPCINLMGIQNIALDLRGTELYIDYFDKPDLANHILDVSTGLSIIIGNRLRKLSKNVSAGVSSIISKTIPDVYLTSNCSVEMISLDQYRNFLITYDNRLANIFLPFGIHHCGRSMEHVVDAYAEIMNLSFVEAGAGSDIAAIRRVLPKAHINARYSPVKLTNVDYEELNEDIRQMIKAGAPSELLSISCVGIDAGVHDDQIKAFLDICSLQAVRSRN